MSQKRCWRYIFIYGRNLSSCSVFHIVSVKASFMERLIPEADASHCWEEKGGGGVVLTGSCLKRTNAPQHYNPVFRRSPDGERGRSINLGWYKTSPMVNCCKSTVEVCFASSSVVRVKWDGICNFCMGTRRNKKLLVGGWGSPTLA